MWRSALFGLVVFALVVLSSCGGETTTPAHAAPAPPSLTPDPAPTPSAAAVAALADARRAGPLAELAREGDVESRRRALWALGRVHDDEAAAALVAGLRDPDPEARRAAAFGLGALEAEAPPEAVVALLGAYAAESTSPSTPPSLSQGDPPVVVRSVLATQVWSLARTTDRRVVPALVQALDAESERRVAVCRGLAYGTTVGWPETLLRAALERAARDPSPAVREACWQGLGRTPLSGALAEQARAHAIEAVTLSADDPVGVELRVQAARTLGRVPPVDSSRVALGQAAADPDWRVVVAALRSLGPASAGHEAHLASVLDTVFARWWPVGLETGPASGGALHVVLTAVEVAQPYARAQPLYDRASIWLARAERAPASRDQAWLMCRLAQLVDLGRGWPARVERCGGGVVSDDERRMLIAEILGQLEGAETQRATFLQREFREGGPRAREAVLAAAAHLPTEQALPLLRLGLDEEDEGVLLSALELLGTLAVEAKRQRDESAMAAALRGEPHHAQRVFADLDPQLRAAGRRLLAASSLEARVTLARTIETLADPGLPPASDELAALVAPLASHPSDGVRSQARLALRALHHEDPVSAVEPVPEPLDPRVLADLPRHARIQTERGDVVLELFPDVSPTTVQRFATLAREGAFDGLAFHRVVAGFVVQGGDPRGDGYGGPSWWQRCEDSPLAYERGTVGMALAGRDTGGSQFFVTLGPQHHLDGRYTVFGRVAEGMDRVDALQVGDPIVHVALE
jgi:cyclophilin family peptidyl-prolyl cis-trans isomerase/HEAT repeat protein